MHWCDAVTCGVQHATREVTDFKIPLSQKLFFSQANVPLLVSRKRGKNTFIFVQVAAYIHVLASFTSSWTRRQRSPPKHRYPTTALRSVMTKKELEYSSQWKSQTLGLFVSFRNLRHINTFTKCIFFLHHRVQNDSGAHPASYPMCTRGIFPRG
jgi:hypothetical protein